MTDAARFYQGEVFHARLRPRPHRFRYPVHFLRLDVDAVDQANRADAALQPRAWFAVDRWRPFAFYRRDHGFRDDSSLRAWATHVLHSLQCTLPDGALYLYTFPRLWGFAFKPVSFWHWHNTRGELSCVIAEVNNTFGETHTYLLRASEGVAIDARTPLSCAKCFHVSPFCAATGTYHFLPRVQDDSYFMGIDHDDENGPLLKTSLTGKALPFNAKTALRLMLSQPLMTFGVIARIHWQALHLWFKRTPFYRKPSPPATETSS